MNAHSQGKLIFVVESKIETVSEANRGGEYWRKKNKRHSEQHMQIRSIFNLHADPIPLPCLIVLTRLTPRLLDDHDNLRMAFKYIVDAIADCLIQGKAPGRSDSSPLFKWDYKQEKSSYNGIRIEIFDREIDKFF